MLHVIIELYIVLDYLIFFASLDNLILIPIRSDSNKICNNIFFV